MVKFALITRDAAWIKRHNGRADADGRVFVTLPADEVEKITFAGKDWLRHKFADRPKDIPNALVMCPAGWVPDTAATLTFQREDMRAEFIKRYARG